MDWSSDVCSSDLPVARRETPSLVSIWSKTGVSTCFLTRNYSLSAREDSKDQPVRSQNDDDSACGGREASASSLLFDHCLARRARAASAGPGCRHACRLDHQQHGERELRYRCRHRSEEHTSELQS